MKWVWLALATAVVAFAVSAFVSRDETCTGDGGNRYLPARTCQVTYWWD